MPGRELEIFGLKVLQLLVLLNFQRYLLHKTTFGVWCKVNAHIEKFFMSADDCYVLFRSKKQAQAAFKEIRNAKDQEIENVGRLILPNIFQ